MTVRAVTAMATRPLLASARKGAPPRPDLHGRDRDDGRGGGVAWWRARRLVRGGAKLQPMHVRQVLVRREGRLHAGRDGERGEEQAEVNIDWLHMGNSMVKGGSGV